MTVIFAPLRYTNLRRNDDVAEHVQEMKEVAPEHPEAVAVEVKMAHITVNPECPGTVRRVRRIIRKRFGTDAAAVFSEAMANAREHGVHGDAELVLHRCRFEVKNAASGRFQWQTDKPAGEGGYGLHIIERMGASLEADDHHCCVRWNMPSR